MSNGKSLINECLVKNRTRKSCVLFVSFVSSLPPNSQFCRKREEETSRLRERLLAEKKPTIQGLFLKNC